MHVPKLEEKQPDRTERITGPPLSIAKDDKGAWTKAALGFAKKNDLAPAKLAVISTEKGDYVGFEKKTKGQRTLALLTDVMTRTLRGLSFPKFMNWDATLPDGNAFPFGRPIRWMVALFGTRVVPYEIRVVGSPSVTSGRKTRGHRFLAPRGKRAGVSFAVANFRELKQKLKQHYVILESRGAAGAPRDRAREAREEGESPARSGARPGYRGGARRMAGGGARDVPSRVSESSRGSPAHRAHPSPALLSFAQEGRLHRSDEHVPRTRRAT